MGSDLNKLSICINLLQEVLGEVSYIMSWLEFPHPNIKNKKPREAMVDGDIDLVISELKRMRQEQPS